MAILTFNKQIIRVLAMVNFRDLYTPQKAQSVVTWQKIEYRIKNKMYQLNYQLLEDIYKCTHQFQDKYPDGNIVQLTKEALEDYCEINFSQLDFDFTQKNCFPQLYTPLVATIIKTYLSNRTLCPDEKFQELFYYSTNLDEKSSLLINIYCTAIKEMLKEQQIEIQDTDEDLQKIVFDTAQLAQAQTQTFMPTTQEKQGKGQEIRYNVKYFSREELIKFITSLQIKN